jgi:hypothetical protein
MSSTLRLFLLAIGLLTSATTDSLAEDPEHATGIVRCVAAARRLAIQENVGVSGITPMFVFLDKSSGIEMNIGCPLSSSQKPYLNVGWDSDQSGSKTIESFGRIASFFLGIADVSSEMIRKNVDACFGNPSAGKIEFESVHIDCGKGFIEIWSNNVISPPYSEAAIQPAKQLLAEYDKPLVEQSKSQIAKYEKSILDITETPNALEAE